jgi:hypothetical protein
MTPRELTLDEVSIEIEVEPEDSSVYYHFATDDPERDRAEEVSIDKRARAGDEWAWCCVTVRATWNGIVGEDNLGCCSYEDEEDFKRGGGYYDDMVNNAIDALNMEVGKAFRAIEPLLR